MILKEIKFARKKAFFSGIWVVFFTTLSFLGFFTRDYLLAKTIGINSSLDLFYLVTVLPMFFVNIFCIPFGNALVPKLIKIIKLGKSNSNVLIRHLSFLSFTFCLILCLFTYFFSSNFFSLFHYLGWIKFESTSNLMILLYTPILLLSGLVILVNSILIARGHYIFPSVAQIAVPILSILSLLIFGLHWGVYSVIIGMVVGQITNFILIKRVIDKEKVHLCPFEIKSTLPNKAFFWRGYIHLIVIALFASITILTNTLLALPLGEGAISVLNLGTKISLFFTGAISSGFTSVLLPYLSRMAIYNNQNLINKEISFLIIFGSILSLPFALVLFLNAEPISTFIFTKLSSDNLTILSIASVMKYSIIQLPFWVTNSIIFRHATAIYKIKVFAIIAISTFFINLLLGLFLIKFMNVGGLSLASSIALAFSSGFMLLYYVRSKIIEFYDAILIFLSWISFILIILVHNFNHPLIQLSAILFLVFILILKVKKIGYSGKTVKF